jgi:hypothetical protein
MRAAPFSFALEGDVACGALITMANKRKADSYAKAPRPILIELRHMPVEKIADELTRPASVRPHLWG